jgi:ubiquinone/menaquinone biosynthesis C-methylase UbiE
MTPNPRAQISTTYSAAADHYQSPALAFWNYFGEHAVQRAAPAPGAIVLDVCCGAGGSAIPAARAAGPDGRVIGVDLAPGLLALARARAAAEGIANAEFRHASFEQVYFRPASFDAVICVFGIFFFPDMAGAARKMWRFLRPGGQLAITTWRSGSLEPLHTVFWEAVRRQRPELYKPVGARSRLAGAGAVESLFAEAGIPGVELTHEDREQLIESVEDWWTIAMGTGFRGTIDQLTPEERDRVRVECLALPARSVRLPVTYAIARR